MMDLCAGVAAYVTGGGGVTARRTQREGLTWVSDRDVEIKLPVSLHRPPKHPSYGGFHTSAVSAVAAFAAGLGAAVRPSIGTSGQREGRLHPSTHQGEEQRGPQVSQQATEMLTLLRTLSSFFPHLASKLS